MIFTKTTPGMQTYFNISSNPYCKSVRFIWCCTTSKCHMILHLCFITDHNGRFPWAYFFKYDFHSNSPRYCSQKVVNTSFTVFYNIAFCWQWFQLHYCTTVLHMRHSGCKGQWHVDYWWFRQHVELSPNNNTALGHLLCVSETDIHSN